MAFKRGVIASTAALGVAWSLVSVFWSFFYTSELSGTVCWVLPSGHSMGSTELLKGGEVSFGVPCRISFPVIATDELPQECVAEHGSVKGLQGFQPHFGGMETNDGQFMRAWIMSLSAVLVTTCGLCLSARLAWKTEYLSCYVHGPYLAYVRSLFVYFLAALVVNTVALISFVEYRCHFHNIGLCGEVLPPAGLRVAKTLYLVALTSGGGLTNLLLERQLLSKARMMQSMGGSVGRGLACLTCLVDAQLCMVSVVIIAQVAVTYDFTIEAGPGVLGVRWNPAWNPIAQVVGVLFGVLHVATSASCACLFVRPFREFAIGDAWRMRALKTTFHLSVVAVISSLAAYGNFAVGFVDVFTVIPLDSVINDVCTILLSFSAQTELAHAAHEVQQKSSELAVTLGDMSCKDDVETASTYASTTRSSPATSPESDYLVARDTWSATPGRFSVEGSFDDVLNLTPVGSPSLPSLEKDESVVHPFYSPPRIPV